MLNDELGLDVRVTVARAAETSNPAMAAASSGGLRAKVR
jgi:hypothetical protein